MRSQQFVLPAALALALGLSACGSGSAAPTESSAPTSRTEETTSSETATASFSEADVTFLQSMIPHHDQANEMANLALGRTQRRELEEFARGIVDKQSAEIQQMRSLLEAAGEDPDGMSGSGHEGMDMEQMPGMMSQDDVAALEELQGPEFDLAFLEMMTEHHQGAIEMAETALVEGENPQVQDLADRIIADQQAEIERMNQWQQEWA